MKNVMLDLETMGNRPRSAIVAIGAVFFDANGLDDAKSQALHAIQLAKALNLPALLA